MLGPVYTDKQVKTKFLYPLEVCIEAVITLLRTKQNTTKCLFYYFFSCCAVKYYSVIVYTV